jgi:predicted unusual protein kinase regulating ubiquinone biosynthesis (AarF/ABC1/UbiB family)
VLHGDPHPGNFLFPDGERVVVLDYGCVKEFAPAEVRAFGRLLRTVMDGRRADLADAAVGVGLVHPDSGVDLDELWAMLCWMLAPYLQRGPNARRLSFPPPWLWLQRTLFGLHSVLAKLEAEGEFRDLVRPVVEGA